MSIPSKVPRFENYEVLDVLGEGGMGIVYLARERRADLQVAIKVMSKRMHDPEVQSRFLRENEIISRLNHRNIVRCYEITRTADGLPSIVMEYLAGVDFRAFEGRPYPELLPLMIQACMGMQYLQDHKVVHRDLSSNNVMVILENEKRLVKLVDFGIAKVLYENPPTSDVHTQTGQFLGKFAFASPELFRTTDVDWRSDIYSLGVIFFRLLTNRPPIKVERSGNFFEWVMAHEQPQVLDFTVPGECPSAPPELEAAIRAMLAKDRDERPQSYEELIAQLDAVQVRAQHTGWTPDLSALASLPAQAADRTPSRPSAPSPGSLTPRPGRFPQTPSPAEAGDAALAPRSQRGGRGSRTPSDNKRIVRGPVRDSPIVTPTPRPFDRPQPSAPVEPHGPYVPQSPQELRTRPQPRWGALLVIGLIVLVFTILLYVLILFVKEPVPLPAPAALLSNAGLERMESTS